MAQSLTDTVRPRPSVIFKVFLDKLKPIWTFLASDELAKRGSVSQKMRLHGQKMPKIAFSLSPPRSAYGAQMCPFVV